MPADVMVTMHYYTLPHRHVTLKLWDKQGHKLAQKTITHPPLEPVSFGPRIPAGGFDDRSYPLYEVLTADGITEVIEHRQFDRAFDITDDPAIKRKGGRVISYAVRTDLETDHVLSVLYTPSDGLLWIAHQSALAVFKPPPASSYEAEQGLEYAWDSQSIARSGRRRPGNILDEHIALPQAPGDAVQLSVSQPGVLTRVTDLLQSKSGAIRVISSDAIFDFSAGRFTLVSDVRFQGALMGAAVEDQDGNLWVAAQTGLLRVARQGFTTFREPDGLGRTVGRVFVGRAGEPIAISEGWRVSRFNGESFQTVRANVPESARRFGPTDQSVVEDRAGDWWFATGVGLVRFSGVKRIEDLATMAPRLYTSRDGLAQDDIRTLFEDASGGIWIAGLIPGREVLTRWDRATGQFRRYSDADGLPAFNSPTSFYEDPRGVLWIGFRDGGIARHEAGHFRMLTESNGLPRGGIGAAIADHTGRLWCANSLLGLYRIDDLDAEHLRPVFVATPKDLRGALIARFVEDPFGSILYLTSASNPGMPSPAPTPLAPLSRNRL
jgi:hypothetical protein